jgi:hypothetical protein
VDESAKAAVLSPDFCAEALALENELEQPIYEYLARILPKLNCEQLSTFMGHCDRFFSQLARVDFDWKAETLFNRKWGGCF